MAKFIKSASSFDSWIKDQTTEICFAGRSNVGKSSIINALANQQIAKSSKTPGRTQLVNFYDFGSYRLVDLPGYGYMLGGNKLRNDITKIIDEYLTQRVNLYAIFQVCDANVVTELDSEMSKYFQKRFKNHYILLNKIDKANISKYHNQLPSIAKFLRVQPDKIILISAKNKLNISSVKSTITKTLQAIK
jgi:GTP-binding protein